MDTLIKQKIQVEIAKHGKDELKAIAEFCKTTQAKHNLPMQALGKTISKKFNLTEVVGFRLAIVFNRYMI